MIFTSISPASMSCAPAKTHFYVLEDNVRTPSGVSYMLENREVMMRLHPRSLRRASRRAGRELSRCPARLAALGRAAAARARARRSSLLTPGQYNSAYYEHSFLADKLGVELVEGRDLLVQDDVVYMRTTQGPKRVDVIYRRIDDDFLDPEAFRPDSALGVPGLMRAYLAGNVTLANAVGTGVADDKAIYTYMPEIIRFYLGEKALLEECADLALPRARALCPMCSIICPNSSSKRSTGRAAMACWSGRMPQKRRSTNSRRSSDDNPENFIAQPTLALSTCPAVFEKGVAPRHVDLRPFVSSGADGIRVMPGGLTRVAMQEGSLVVNSSQGGGTKDTWIVEEPAAGRMRRRACGIETCFRARRIISSGSPAIWSAPISSPGSSRRRSGSPRFRTVFRTGTEWESALEASGAAEGFDETQGGARGSQRRRISDLRGRQSVLDPQLHRMRARQCASAFAPP